jgi:transcriptional regulator with XRE-family HTH domain
MEHDWEKVFGSRIREMRQLRGWTQDELARLMSDAGHQMHQTTLAKLEGGTRPTSVAEVGALATLLEVPIWSLFGAADRLEKQMELNGLGYRLKSLTAEADRVTTDLEALLQRRAEIENELATVLDAYTKAEKSLSDKFEVGDDLVILGSRAVAVNSNVGTGEK